MKIKTSNLAKIKSGSGDSGRTRSRENYVFGIIGIAWAIFQLALPGGFVMDSTGTRAIHLSFAIALLYLSVPLLKRPGRFFRLLSDDSRVPIADYLLAVFSAAAALYLALNYENIAMRAGMPTMPDLVIGSLLVIFLLEAARRSVGPALSIIALLFTIYAFTGPYLPDLLAFKGVSLRKYINNIALSTEGIYGIPLGVSASIVYLFVLLGAILDRAGAGNFFTELALSVLGKYKGGAAKAAVVSSGATGLISGSSIANIVTTGPFTIPLMKKIGYPPKKAAAIEVAASTDGQLMPPIMGAAAFIIAEYVNVPYIEVVKAAAIPALASYFGLFCISHLEASKLGIEGLPKEDIPGFIDTLKKGVHYLLPLVVLLYELVILRHSPELSAFRAIMLLFLVIIYQEIRGSLATGSGFTKGIFNGFRIIVQGLIRGSKNMIPVALACATAGIIVGIVNMGIGGMISEIVESLAGGNIYLLLIITAAASLLLGMGLPTTATYIVMASLTAPIIVKAGNVYDIVIPVMSAHLFCFYFGILADDTPPVGLAAYAASAIAGSPPVPTGIQGFLYDIRTSVIAFMMIFNTDIILFNITSWSYGILVLIMTLTGMASFCNLTQGFCITRNRWYDSIFFLLAAIILFQPRVFIGLLNLQSSRIYIIYLAGVLLYAAGILLQKSRNRKALPAACD